MKILASYLLDIEELILNMYGKTQNSQHNTEEEGQNWKADYPASRFTLHLQ